MMSDNTFEIFVDTFEKRLLREPKWPTKSISAALVELLEKEETGPFRLNRSVQTGLNNLTHSIARRYTKDIAQVKGVGENSLVFEKAKLFPIHTMEWNLATLEIATNHRKELSWIGRVMFARCEKAMRQKYGPTITNQILDITDSVKPVKTMDWNVTMMEVISYTQNFGNIVEGSSLLEELVASNAKKSWGARDLMQMEELITDILSNEEVSTQTKNGMIFFSIISKVNAKAKADDGPTAYPEKRKPKPKKKKKKRSV